MIGILKMSPDIIDWCIVIINIIIIIIIIFIIKL